MGGVGTMDGGLRGWAGTVAAVGFGGDFIIIKLHGINDEIRMTDDERMTKP